METDRSNERLLWKNEIKTGIINRKVAETQMITNQRVLKNDYSYRLEDIVDVFVANQHRISNSQYIGVRPRYSNMTFGRSQSRSKTIGDVVFFHNNGEFSFQQIEDPQTVVRIVKAARKKILTEIMKIQKNIQKENRKYTKCYFCGSNNSIKSEFCNKCGNQLTSSESSKTESYVSESMQSQAENFESFELLSEGIKIQYPSDWVVLEDQSEPPTIATFLSPLEDPLDNFREPLLIQKHIINENISLDQYLKNVTNEISERNNNTPIHTEPIIISDKHAYKINYKIEDLITYIIITLEKNIASHTMSSYWIATGIKEDKHDKFLPIINRMVESFEII